LLDAARVEIGSKGFAEASVSSITRQAGVGQGTYYIYFKSKEEIMRALVLEMGRDLRQQLSDINIAAPDRFAAERAGLRHFIAFARDNPDLYRIVQEAQFVDDEVYRAYFEEFASGYRKTLETAVQAGEISDGDLEVRAWLLLGLGRSMGEVYGLWQTDVDIDYVVDTIMDILEHGMKARKG
jgi:AcrR family transcriptional regulator